MSFAYSASDSSSWLTGRDLGSISVANMETGRLASSSASSGANVLAEVDPPTFTKSDSSDVRVVDNGEGRSDSALGVAGSAGVEGGAQAEGNAAGIEMDSASPV